MKEWSDAAQAAIEDGSAISHGAVYVACAPDPLAVWSGYGSITLPDSQTYVGIGDRGLILASGNQLGTSAQAITLALSGVDPANLALLDQSAVRDAPVLIWRLVFDSAGRFLDARVENQGVLDQLSHELTEDGTYTLTAAVENLSRLNGRNGGRIAAGADQRLIAANDGSLDDASSAGSVTLYWGGKPPVSASGAN